MLKNKSISHFPGVNETSLSKKRWLSFFILLCMFTNGFVFNANSGNKYSFAALLTIISKNAAVQILSKCGGSMLQVSGKICVAIADTMLPAKNSRVPLKDTSKKESKSSGAACAVMQNVLNRSDKVIKDTADSDCACVCFAVSSAVFKICDKYRVYDGRSNLIMILFIIFIVSIRKRKGLTGLNQVSGFIWQRKVSA